MNARDILIKSLIWLIAISLHLPNAWSGSPAPAADQTLSKKEERTPVTDSCTIQILNRHYNLYCLDREGLDRLPRPEVRQTCGAPVDLAYEETYYPLGCTATGFKQYFDLSNWKVSKNNGDGGVDVTGAPNELLVEGANNTLIDVGTGGRTRMEILLPADGFITLDWRKIGGSNLFSNPLEILVNDRPLDRPGHSTFFSPLLTQGDRFILEIRAEAGVSVELSDFQFLTSALGVWERRWTATGDRPALRDSSTQFIVLEKPNISDVVFPADIGGPGQPGLEGQQALSPETTGYPVIDRDGDPETLYDQYILNSEHCAFAIDYQDEVQDLGDHLVIHRRWTVIDQCGNNTIRATQIIKLDPAQLPDSMPDSILFDATPKEDASPSTELSSKKRGDQDPGPGDYYPMTF